MLLTVNLVIYFLVVCIGGGVVEMDIWSKIFAGNFDIIFKVGVYTEREEWGEANLDSCGQGVGEGEVKNHWECVGTLYYW